MFEEEEKQMKFIQGSEDETENRRVGVWLIGRNSPLRHRGRHFLDPAVPRASDKRQQVKMQT